MNRTLKIFAVALFAVALLLAIPASAFAEDKAVKFTVTAEDGTVTEYYDETQFVSAISNAKNNEKITLCSNITIGGSIALSATSSSPKSLTVDLAGYGISALMKITVFSVRDYVTLNVYSSSPDAYLYVVGSNAASGGNMFSIIGKEARVNFGDMTVGDVTYPGSNISTFSSCFVDVRQSGTQGFFASGGNHYANIRDWNAFICARTGEGRVEVKNSNIISLGSNALLYNEVKTNSFLFENCVILNMNNTQEALIKNVVCPVTLKDCVTNYCLASSAETKTPGIITLLGDNIFGTDIPFDTELLAEGTPEVVLANINRNIELVGGGYDGWYFDDLGKFNKIPLTLPEARNMGVITSSDNAVQYTWNYNGESVTQLWHKDAKPEMAFQLPSYSVSGMYKYAWTKTVLPDGSIVYNGGKVADFDISISAVYDGETLSFKIYVPAYVIDEGYLLYSGVVIADAAYYASEWEPITVDGKEYYTVQTVDMNKECFTSPFEVVLPFDFPEGKGQSTYVTTTWQIIPSLYVERVLENAEAYDSAAVDVVKRIANDFSNNQA